MFGSPTRPLAPAPKGNVADVETADPEIAAARGRPRASLEHFWSRLGAPAPGEAGCTVKIGLPTRTGSLENIWVRDIRRAGEVITGRLANDPVDIAGLRGDSPVTFKAADISDWSYKRNGRFIGNELGRVLVERMPAAERTKYRAMFAER